MKKLFLFTTPKRTSSIEDYELDILYKISDKFSLGDLLEYSRWTEGNINFIYARFKGGSVKLKYIEGKEGIALIRVKKKYLNKNKDFS
ncbi:hypothetical protein EWF20_04405 [Sulfolobus sp. S-194]|uniref:hypothetical protein n=1 Tax=Sulfolobus sp. S-194 TaxID=2512240 RepID=UPI0014371535|nr:hypothetical protein [Sulfolobus sp. S-194]QIW23468.1 hypothetical protein EWF20_04405 [Sulfolobus sp. S-194]